MNAGPTVNAQDAALCPGSRRYAEAKILSEEASETIVLAGNPNVGKSVIFNALTGKYTQVSNFPGTTVDIPRGMLPDQRLLKDTPGVYGISNISEEELVAEKAILSADRVINVVSALSLERDLFLTQQIIDYQRPMVVVVNQMDEAKANGINLDLNQLEELLGVPVIPTVAVTCEGVDLVLPALTQARPGNPMADCPDAETLAQLEADPGKRLQIYGLRRQHVNAIAHSVVNRDTDIKHPSLSKTLGKLFLNPVIGLFSGLFVIFMLYQIVGVWVAGNVVDFTEGTLMLEYVVPSIQKLVGTYLDQESAWYFILAGEFGVFTMSIQYIFGVLFPLILGFYVFISILEDCGYLPRIAVLCDSFLNRIGLNGRAVIPLILGLGCVTMATISTRVLTSQRERTIASTILAVTIPCSAQIGVLVGLMAYAGGLRAWMIYCVIIFSVLAFLGTLLNILLPGRSSGLLLDLPPIRMPSMKNIAQKTWVRTMVFLKEAAPLFVLGSLLVSLAQVSGLLLMIEHWLEPVTVRLLHLPSETANMFIMGMVRRDFGAAGLYFMVDSLTSLQVLTALVTITLFVPCIASAAVIFKERGTFESTAILIGSWTLAFGVGAVVTRLVGWTGLL